MGNAVSEARCGFCQREWAVCERDICPERSLLKSVEQSLNDARVRDQEHLRLIQAAREEGYQEGYLAGLNARKEPIK
jgi:hypothetical protein